MLFDKQNVIILMIDQLRNDKRYLHPIFNTLQKRGALFSQMITYAPYTLASMHAVFTGMYGNKNGVDAYYKAKDYKADSCYTLPQYLKEKGYYTCVDTFSKILLPSQGVDDFNLYDENTVKNIYRRHTLLLDKTVMKDEPFFLFLHYPKIHKEIVENVIQKYDDFDKNYFGNEKENHARYDKLVIEAGYYLERMIDYIEIGRASCRERV